MLITQQSQDELYRVLLANSEARQVRVDVHESAEFMLSLQAGNLSEVKTIVVSVSPQSTASLAASYNLSAPEVHQTHQ